MNHDTVARLRRLMSDAVPTPGTRTAAAAAADAFAYFEANAPPQHHVVQSVRARQERDIARIANWYGLLCEITRALDAAAATTLTDVDDAGLERLHVRMLQLEQCVQHGLDPPDSPAAR